MDGSDPYYHNSDPLGADDASEEAYCRGRAGDPVKAIRDAEHRQTIDRHISKAKGKYSSERPRNLAGARKPNGTSRLPAEHVAHVCCCSHCPNGRW
jgi:hypothetical protein